jgi:hypothetical protein
MALCTLAGSLHALAGSRRCFDAACARCFRSRLGAFRRVCAPSAAQFFSLARTEGGVRTGGARGRRVEETRGTRVRMGRRAARVAQGQSCPKPGSSVRTTSFAANVRRFRTSSIYDTEGVLNGDNIIPSLMIFYLEALWILFLLCSNGYHSIQHFFPESST